jgi:hypothetical protein
MTIDVEAKVKAAEDFQRIDPRLELTLFIPEQSSSGAYGGQKFAMAYGRDN